MELFERQVKKYAIVINVNLVRATLNEATEFREYLNEAILGTDIDIIVNLSDCQHLDSTFLGVLVSGYKKLKKKNRNLVIIEPTDKSRVFLTLNSIGKIFPLYESVNSALEDIENKKLLENVVEDIDVESSKNQIDSEPVELPVKQVEDVNPNPQVLVQEELTTIELDNSVNSSDDTNENKILMDEFALEAETLSNLKEENEKIKFENLDKVEEEYHEEIEAYPEPKPLYSEINFKKGSVDWAFGFN
ncbi:MAG: STAS domain-containing protein [Ignavibacteriaceae bacterium]|nr:STAS domain-containing protein [Ignavibacteriaceae bacterium]